MTDREIMQQALEVLDHFYVMGYNREDCKEMHELLRERLARECCCGEPHTPGIVHRIDGSCYVAEPARQEQEPVAWPIETNDQVEALAKECGWANRNYMTPADYQVWCDRMRMFARLAAQPAQQEPVAWREVDK